MPAAPTRFTGLRVGPSGTGNAADITLVQKGTLTFNPASISAATSPEVSITLATAKAGDIFLLWPPSSLNAGLIVQGVAECRVDGTIVSRIANVTAGALDPASGTWGYIQIRA